MLFLCEELFKVMEKITSLQNQHVKRWRKLLTRKGRTTFESFLVEGFHLVEEALKAKKIEVLAVIGTENVQSILENVPHHIPTYQITKEIMTAISDTETSQEIFAEVKMPSQPDYLNLEAPYLLLDAVQDPGNVGTLIRTAAACGFEGVVFGKGTVDPYNPKTLRAAQGSHFNVSLLQVDLKKWITDFQRIHVPVYGTALHKHAVSYRKVTPQQVFGLVVGNEGAGVSEKILKQVDQSLYIPIRGHVESLNVSMAAGILMYHLYQPAKGD